ncbi:hypothetical protein ACFFX1_34540 [Dactylosporangium sucinum]|uniref:EVE domain-containing protein n=1 Tax=Dactylosporangium sucinum TaxID=1424081 RepID=A0A917X1P0_9ACTN|nr:hypothetical protein [Dactylosporangium sucinum]GGM51048.1 hypothetical protein GCM10007977_061070 [Dactylosporangium sucinum]
MSRNYLLVLGDREGIAWVLYEQRMAFPSPSTQIARLAVGDALFLYATRGAWHNTRRDRGRIFGTATVTSPVDRLAEPVEVRGTRLLSGCNLQIDGIVPYPGGMELKPLVHRLALFRKPDGWGAYLHRTLVPLSDDDAATLHRTIAPMLKMRDETLSTYPCIVDVTADKPPISEVS